MEKQHLLLHLLHQGVGLILVDIGPLLPRLSISLIFLLELLEPFLDLFNSTLLANFFKLGLLSIVIGQYT
jgi:hypothetical protein